MGTIYRLNITGDACNLMFQVLPPAKWSIAPGWLPLPAPAGGVADPGFDIYLECWRYGLVSTPFREFGIVNGDTLVVNTNYGSVNMPWGVWLQVDTPNANVLMNAWAREGRGAGVFFRSVADSQNVIVGNGSSQAAPVNVGIVLSQ